MDETTVCADDGSIHKDVSMLNSSTSWWQLAQTWVIKLAFENVFNKPSLNELSSTDAEFLLQNVLVN